METARHAAVGWLADADHAVDTLAHQVDQSVALADVQPELRVAVEIGGQLRDDQGPGHEAVHVDPQRALGLGIGEDSSASSTSARMDTQ